MPRSSVPTRQAILDGAYGLFRRKGFVRVSMDEIAASAAVTKRTLYYHFTSKDLLLAQVLEAQHALALPAFRTFGEGLAGSPESMIDHLFKDLAVWSDQPRWAGSGFTRLVIELADLRGHPARLIARHKAMLEGHLADLLASAHVASPRELAREIWLLSEGAIALILIHGDRSYAAAAAEAAKKLIRSDSAFRRSYSARRVHRAANKQPGPVGNRPLRANLLLDIGDPRRHAEFPATYLGENGDPLADLLAGRTGEA
jgi:AcrR family transcriptional regulator